MSLVNTGLDAGIIRLSPLIHEGEQRYKPYIVGDPLMVSLLGPPPPFEKSWLRPLSMYLFQDIGLIVHFRGISAFTF